MHTGRTGVDHGLHELEGVERSAEAGLRVRDDRRHPVLHGVDVLGVLDLVRTLERVVDPAHHLGNRVRRVEGLVRVGLAREVRVTGDLPTGEVDRLEPGLDLLDGLVTGQSAQSIDVILRVEQVPEPFRTAAGVGVLFSKGTLQTQDLLGGVVTGHAGPAGVLLPVPGEFLGAAEVAVLVAHLVLL